VTTIDDDWRKHRKICTGAFTKSNLRLVRTSTMKHAHHMIDFWKNRSSRNANGEQEYELVLGGLDLVSLLVFEIFSLSLCRKRRSLGLCKKNTFFFLVLKIFLIQASYVGRVWRSHFWRNDGRVF
jgi:hypothetical protein